MSSWYSLQSNPLNTNLELILDDLIDVFAGQASALGNKATALDLDHQSGFLNDDVFGFLDNGMTSMNSSKPKAALNWILFDEQFKIVNSSSGFEQVGNDEEFKIHQFNGITMNKNGYLFVYVSNADENIPVFFDNLHVTHTRGPILEETHYYPFGLTMAGISTKAVEFVKPVNQKKYNAIELENDLEIQIYDAFFRELDPQIARWWQIDPVTEGYEDISPYASMYNNPIFISDPLGNEGEGCCGGLFGELVDAGKKILISSAGLLNGTLNTVSGGYISTDPFDFRETLSEEDKGWFDGGVSVGQVVPLFITPRPSSQANPFNFGKNNYFQTSPTSSTPLKINTQVKTNAPNPTQGTSTKPKNAPHQNGTPNTSKIETQDASGKTTKYTTYDKNGNIKKQVQVSKGKSRHGIEGATKKVPVYNTNPKTGQKHANGYKIKKAMPAETPPGKN